MNSEIWMIHVKLLLVFNTDLLMYTIIKVDYYICFVQSLFKIHFLHYSLLLKKQCVLQMLRYSITFLPLIKIILNELLSFFVHAWHVCWLIYAKYLASKCNVFLDNRHFLLNFICCNSAIAARGHLIYFDICAFGWIYVPNLNERYTFIILF